MQSSTHLARSVLLGIESAGISSLKKTPDLGQNSTAESLASTHGALGSIPSTAKEKLTRFGSEMARWSTHTYLAEDLHSVPSASAGTSQQPVASAPEDPSALFWPLGASAHICMLQHIKIHTYYLLLLKIKVQVLSTGSQFFS